MFKITCNVLKRVNPTIQGSLRLNNLVTGPSTVPIRNLDEEANEYKPNNVERSRQIGNTNHSLISAAFSLLKEQNSISEIQTPFTDERLANAKTVNELLTISEGNGISRKLALKTISLLSDWTISGKVSMHEFETDVRFVRLCKMLTKGTYLGKANRISNVTFRNDDLSTVLGITAEDDVAKLMSSLSMAHMVKVMSLLSLKGQRSLSLLRTLAFSISAKGEHLNLKQCADLLYSSAILNFIDENLLGKICGDIFLSLENYNSKSAVVGSTLTSLGLLHYKNTCLLDSLSKWVLMHHNNCRPQDIFALFMTLAILNYHPVNSEEVYKILIPQLYSSDARKASIWLDLVWSLVVLNQASSHHISSVLSPSFLTKFQEDPNCSNGSKLKLLNIDSACNLLIGNYTGPRLPNDSPIKRTAITRSKDKANLVTLLQDSLSSLMNPTTHLKTNINTNMGFLIDAEIALDSKHNPSPLSRKDCTKVAIVMLDFHDMCRGKLDPTGINSINVRLLEAQNYKVLVIPYTEFTSSDKYVNRVKYLESRLKTLPLN